MKQVLIFIATVFLVINTHAQSVGIGTPTPNGSAQLDITSTSRGLLIPRMTSAQRLAITTPAAGLMVYETTTNAFWYFNGIVWNQIGTGGASPWAISGNNITNSNTGNVGVGTSTPNTDAILDINSSTKGVLFPRMTTLQRLTISTPPNGLMVYDTDKDQLYHYTGTIWLSVLNSSFWSRPITSRNRIANSTDSVGIGTVSPTEWLDVDGNIRSRNDLRADGRVVATGLVSSASGLSTSGGLTVGSNGLIGGNFTANGELTTNSGININNAGGTLQLKNGSGVNKGFFQISGDNVRLGTNSGNATGDLIIRMNGADRMTVILTGK
jgi:hypothetical protein